jgi:hypothetical protein
MVRHDANEAHQCRALRAVRWPQHCLVRMIFGNAWGWPWGWHRLLPFATTKTTLQITAVEGRDVCEN